MTFKGLAETLILTADLKTVWKWEKKTYLCFSERRIRQQQGLDWEHENKFPRYRSTGKLGDNKIISVIIIISLFR